MLYRYDRPTFCSMQREREMGRADYEESGCCDGRFGEDEEDEEDE